jgi:hypothetical protein
MGSWGVGVRFWAAAGAARAHKRRTDESARDMELLV